MLIPFGSVDPLRGADAVAQARSLVRDHGARGFKFHPSLQAFAPNDPRFYPLWAEIESLGVPALFHSGQTGIGAGLPGGRGIKLRLSDPMLVDDVAADFPGLTVILAHPSVPWAASSISIATHKANVFIDLSGLVAQVLPARAGPGRELAAAGQGAVRHGLPAADPGAVAAGLRHPRHQAGGQGRRSSRTNAVRVLGLEAVTAARAGCPTTPRNCPVIFRFGIDGRVLKTM